MVKNKVILACLEKDLAFFHKIEEKLKSEYEVIFVDLESQDGNWWEQQESSFFIIGEEFEKLIDYDEFALVKNDRIVIKSEDKIYENISLDFCLKSFFKLQAYKKDLKFLSESLELEIDRLHKWYQRQSPSREVKDRNFHYISQYKAGNVAGGDFFDFIRGEDSYLLIMASTNSYVLSSQIVDNVLKLKQGRAIDCAEVLKGISQVKKEVDGFKGQSNELELLLLKIDQRNLHYSGYQFGKIDGYALKGSWGVSNNQFPVDEAFYGKAYFEGCFHGGDRLVFSSPGALKNWLEKERRGDYYKLLKSREDIKESFEQFFLKLYENDGIKRDSSLIYLEAQNDEVYKI